MHVSTGTLALAVLATASFLPSTATAENVAAAVGYSPSGDLGNGSGGDSGLALKFAYGREKTWTNFSAEAQLRIGYISHESGSLASLIPNLQLGYQLGPLCPFVSGGVGVGSVSGGSADADTSAGSFTGISLQVGGGLLIDLGDSVALELAGGYEANFADDLDDAVYITAGFKRYL